MFCFWLASQRHSSFIYHGSKVLFRATLLVFVPLFRVFSLFEGWTENQLKTSFNHSSARCIALRKKTRIHSFLMCFLSFFFYLTKMAYFYVYLPQHARKHCHISSLAFFLVIFFFSPSSIASSNVNKPKPESYNLTDGYMHTYCYSTCCLQSVHHCVYFHRDIHTRRKRKKKNDSFFVCLFEIFIALCVYHSDDMSWLAKCVLLFPLHCMRNQIHLICISISQK